jgi:hypothetical protein
MVCNATTITRPTNKKIRLFPLEPTAERWIAPRPGIRNALAAYGVNKTSMDRLIQISITGEFEHVLITIKSENIKAQDIFSAIDVPPKV